MGRAFTYVILGGGVAAGYAAHEFVKQGVREGQLCIISDEAVAPYERPTLSKAFLLTEAARLPSFHCCVGSDEERLDPKWYEKHGIELILRTRVKSADVKRKTILTEAGETISYHILIVATGARALKLEDIGIEVSNAENVCYLRNLVDAQKLVSVMQMSRGGNAVVIGGGYIGMECAAALAIKELNVTMVFPASHLMARLFTPQLASYYEKYYNSYGVKFIKGASLTSFTFNSEGKVNYVNLRGGNTLPADMVVVGIGSKPNSSLFQGQLTLDDGGIKVNEYMQSSNISVYAVGDVSAFPVKLYGGVTRRLEHVDCARKAARHAVEAIMNPMKKSGFDYLPFFYSRVFSLSWKFYGDNNGEVVHFDESKSTFGAYWIYEGHLVGAFLEGGTKEEHEVISKVIRLKPAINDISELQRCGLNFAFSVISEREQRPILDSGTCGIVLEKPMHALHATAGVIVAMSIAAFAYWFQRCGT